MLSTTLFHISELSKVPAEVAQAIRSVAWLLGELEEETVALSTRTAVNDQLDYMNTETKHLLDEIRTTISEEVEKHMGAISTAATKALEEKSSKQFSYRDAALANLPLPRGTDPRILAREGIRARQFIVDIPGDAPLARLGQADILKRFNEVMGGVGVELGESGGKIRSVQKLANKGILGEFLTDEGAKWFADQNHANAFITALGEDGQGATVKKRNHPMIAYYVPLNLNTENPSHLAEINEANNLQPGDLVKLRWAKPPARRAPNQICGHLILSFTSPDAANRAKTEGLLICNKRVSVAKYKKEPIRCLKCQGWNHVAAECAQSYDKCGTCGTRGHRTSACTSTTTHCANCDTDDHTSWSRDCPTFIRKCHEFDIKHPENGLPYYPSAEPWTWAPDPLAPEGVSAAFKPGPPPTVRNRPATQRLRQQQLSFATRSNAIQVPTQGTSSRWSDQVLQSNPRNEISDHIFNTQGDPLPGAEPWH
jgi:hypothetical protein